MMININLTEQEASIVLDLLNNHYDGRQCIHDPLEVDRINWVAFELNQKIHAIRNLDHTPKENK